MAITTGYYGKPYDKRIDGKTFHLLGGFNRKTDAKKEASKIRESGSNARTVPVADGYDVYYTGAWRKRVVG